MNLGQNTGKITLYACDGIAVQCTTGHVDSNYCFNQALTVFRHMLCQELEYYGPGTFQQQLDKAYKDFNRFSRSNKMDQSQPPFKESKVPWY